jgi:phenylacetic acid degradation operon negative regulatory protein
MTEEIDSWFENAVARLSDPGNQRVWSIIVSLFGDMAQDPDDRISGGALTRIIGPMGIKPEAIRVALHRLRKDGWIESTRNGRTSVHLLTDFGRSQSVAVTPRIYSRTPDLPSSWHLLIAEEGTGQRLLDEVLLTRDYVSIGRHSALGSGPVPRDCDDLLAITVADAKVPDWLRNRIFNADLVSACASLLEDLKALPDVPAGLTPDQTATLRTLVVHRWRRVVLRHPELPEGFHPTSWPGAECRTRVFALLDQLPRPAITDLADISET